LSLDIEEDWCEEAVFQIIATTTVETT